jgi:hypothetical protein
MVPRMEVLSMRISRLSPSLSLGLIAAALAFAAGCSDGGASGSTEGSGGSGSTTSSTGTGGSAPTPGNDLDGTWETVCWQKAKTTITYDHLALDGTYTEYSDDACASAIHVSKWTGTAAVTGQTAAGDTKIDIAFATFTSTALTAENAAFNNMNQYCGFTDWEANVQKDVLGKPCYGFSIPVGGKSLDIYRVEGDTLKFGKGALIGASLGEADRPTVIDDTRVFTRK